MLLLLLVNRSVFQLRASALHRALTPSRLSPWVGRVSHFSGTTVNCWMLLVMAKPDKDDVESILITLHPLVSAPQHRRWV